MFLLITNIQVIMKRFTRRKNYFIYGKENKILKTLVPILICELVSVQSPEKYVEDRGNKEEEGEDEKKDPIIETLGDIGK